MQVVKRINPKNSYLKESNFFFFLLFLFIAFVLDN